MIAVSDPNAPHLFRLRCTFVEFDRLAMLSHLEVAHTLERTVRRAGLPFAVSQGFSPHMRIAFGSALPVGVGSTCELFDVWLKDYVPAEKALDALRQASVPDLMVRDCRYIEGSAPAASVAFPFSTYEIRFDAPVDAEAFAVPDAITVRRKGKKKKGKKAGDVEKTLVVGDFLAEAFAFDGDRATFTLEVKPTGSLRPDVLLQHCECEAAVLSITRVEQRSQLCTR